MTITDTRPPESGEQDARDPVTAYLEESAAQLRQCREYNDGRRRLAAAMHDDGVCTSSIDHEVAERSADIAAWYATLAAIAAGLPPCRCHAEQPAAG